HLWRHHLYGPAFLADLLPVQRLSFRQAGRAAGLLFLGGDGLSVLLVDAGGAHQRHGGVRQPDPPADEGGVQGRRGRRLAPRALDAGVLWRLAGQGGAVSGRGGDGSPHRVRRRAPVLSAGLDGRGSAVLAGRHHPLARSRLQRSRKVRKMRVLITLAAALVLGSTAASAQDTTAGDDSQAWFASSSVLTQSTGKGIYDAVCTSCHMADGAGAVGARSEARRV